MIGSKKQVFPYSFKTISSDSEYFFNTEPFMGLEPILPEDVYTIEGLSMKFDFTVDPNNQWGATGSKIISIEVWDNLTYNEIGKPISGNIQSIPVNIGMDVNNKIVFSKDISNIKNKYGKNIIMVRFDSSVAGTINIIKVDILYTVLGNR